MYRLLSSKSSRADRCVMSGEYTSGIPHECCNGIQSDHNAGCRGKSDLTDTDGIKYQTVLGEIMSKISFKAGNMLYPLPVVMVSVADKEGKSNILTVDGLVLSVPIRLW